MVGARAPSGTGATKPGTVAPVDRGTRRLGLYFALGGLMVVLDTTVTIVAIPGLIGDFNSTLATVQWVTTGYVLGLVAVMPLSIWATQRFGPRRSYLAAITVFTAGSLLTGCAWDIPSLICFRVLQGAGGGLINPVGMSIALSAVRSERRGAMMSLQGLPVLIGPLIGPLLGGLLIDHASWRWIFWINVPIGALCVLAGRRILPAPEREHGRTRIDVVGLLLLSPGIALFVLGLSDAGRGTGLSLSGVLLPVSIGAVMIAYFLRHALRVEAPLVNLRALRIRAMSAGSATLMLFVAAYFGSAIIGPAYVQIVRGDSATLTGAIGVPQALATGIALQIATRLVDRVQPRTIIGVGIAVATVGTLARVAVLTPHTPYALFIIFGAVSGLGIGATLSPTMTAATRSLTRCRPDDRQHRAESVVANSDGPGHRTDLDDFVLAGHAPIPRARHWRHLCCCSASGGYAPAVRDRPCPRRSRHPGNDRPAHASRTARQPNAAPRVPPGEERALTPPATEQPMPQATPTASGNGKAAHQPNPPAAPLRSPTGTSVNRTMTTGGSCPRVRGLSRGRLAQAIHHQVHKCHSVLYGYCYT